MCCDQVLAADVAAKETAFGVQLDGAQGKPEAERRSLI